MQVQTKQFKAQIAQARDRIEESDAEYQRIKRKTIPIIKRIDDPLIDLEQRHKMKENTFNRPPSSLPFKTKKHDRTQDYKTYLRNRITQIRTEIKLSWIPITNYSNFFRK